ncbi:MAG: hypothetical protein ACE5GJ_00980 [Gemmatimonadota bacterium]
MIRQLQRMALLAAAVAMIVPASLRAQASPRERAREVLPPAVVSELDALATRMEREGVPSEPLYNKALEGAAKRIPPDRLMPAVTDYARRLREARTALGPRADTPLLMAGADAFRRGIDMKTLRTLARDERPSPMAVLVLADLVETGVPTDRALDLVHEAMMRRARDEMMMGIPADVRQLMRMGHSPMEAAERVREAMRHWRGGSMGMMPPVPPGAEPLMWERDRPHHRRPGGG